MYQIIHDSRELVEWMKHLPLQAEVFERSETIRKRLVQSSYDLDRFHDMKDGLEENTNVWSSGDD